jgi:hypothetical protein
MRERDKGTGSALGRINYSIKMSCNIDQLKGVVNDTSTRGLGGLHDRSLSVHVPLQEKPPTFLHFPQKRRRDFRSRKRVALHDRVCRGHAFIADVKPGTDD